MSLDNWRTLMGSPPDEEESYLLRTLADIRQVMGVGEKPMLDELPGLLLARRDGYAAMLHGIKEVAVKAGCWDEIADIIANGSQGHGGTNYEAILNATKFARNTAKTRAEKAQAERDELARHIAQQAEMFEQVFCKCVGCNMARGYPHKPGCPVALAEKIVKEGGDAVKN